MLDRIVQLGAALGRAQFAGEHQLHPIFVGRQNDGRTADERAAVVVAERDRKMRRGVVRRENVRAADHVERGKFIQLARLDRVGQLDRRDDALNARLLRVFRKNDALDLSAEGRRDSFIFEFVHADV